MSLGDWIQIAGIVCPILLTIAGAASWFVKRHIGSLDKQIDHLREENTNLKLRIEELESQVIDNREVERLRGNLALLQGQYSAAKQREEQLQADLAEWQKATDILRGENKELQVRLEQSESDAKHLHTHQKSLHRRIDRVLSLEGRGWEQHVPKNAPAFVPLSERRVPIISICNLKGGVGKTTITAQLASVMTQRGYRVLLLDLDLQGSLSSLFLGELKVAEIVKQGKGVQNFLNHAVKTRRAKLLDHAVPILDNRAAIIPTTDKLAYAEENLLIQWLFRMAPHDVRFLVRQGLHQHKPIRQKFDLVLIDCPPFLSTCAVNALAASDYVLVPVTPSQKAAERAPQMLKVLKQLHSVNPALQVMGLLANRFHAANAMTARELDLWTELRVQCADQAGLPVYQFATIIRQTAQIVQSETQYSPPEDGSELHKLFHQLAQELEGRLPNDCRRTPAVSV